MAAAALGHADICEVLLVAKANPNAQTLFPGLTPVSLTALTRSNADGVVRTLAAARADPGVRTFFPIAIIATFAGITMWFPKMFGRMMNETLGKVHFWITIVAFNGTFIPLFILGAAGQHRRIYNYNHFEELARPEFQDLRVIATVCTLVMLLAQVIFLYNFCKSLVSGPAASRNPWASNTLEWTTPSPPPHGNWPRDDMPVVYRGPYEYSVPDRDADFWPQNEPPEEAA